ncbi:MocR-like pyridoxine biosynthesis transcription factor PdxR [Labilibaculum euxinus]|uniref:Aminotransferase class I/II-fold pyridoxal phosphate-dependent enzyme n=1 Tax=Labilibaculum euxinus TaxID=2686357 RepID=A0A7M4D9N9_9BACT|nr:PLP-dependent aminotransferase family protein [Labilibaculum euxinus]MUP39368.1 aminotransferase class I/II-fold pyridoxal phosphate-dependent enzyme [Labilibaculum euxinus]MVB08573.1 aminotransferase class I/II-fold pyridoxal phosphate-dependent enzyme [Labilibaculum euxinus]
MILIHLDKNSSIPLFQQIIDQLILMIEKGNLREGDKLPSTRAFSEKLGVNRTTICRAYDELWALGYTESKQGGYSTIRKRDRNVVLTPKLNADLFDWNSHVSVGYLQLESRMNQLKMDENLNSIDFRRLAPDKDCMPVELFRKCANQIMLDQGSTVFQYGDPAGYLPLRDSIAKQMQFHSVSVQTKEVLLTNGAQNALDLVFRMLLNPRDKIAIGMPGYAALIPLLKLYQADIIPITIKEDGLDLEELEKAMISENLKAVYTMPNFQNPTGISTSQTHREKILHLCERHSVPLLEDGFEEEMKYFGKNILPIKSMDSKGIVIYIGTFSKILFPGLRVGWIAAEKKVIEKLTRIKKAGELSGDQLNQAILNLFYEKGYFDQHVKKMHRVYRKRMQITHKALSRFIPVYVKYTKPQGGYTIWFEVPAEGKSEEDFMELLANKGVLVSPGSHFLTKASESVNFRISISCVNEEEIWTGIERIGLILKNE